MEICGMVKYMIKIIVALKSKMEYVKFYYTNGKLLYEVQYLNGQWNGKGKEYDKNGNLIFDGEFKNDIIWNGNGYDG